MRRGTGGVSIAVDYAVIARKAQEQVSKLDEPYKSIAYQTILQDLIAEAKKVSSGEEPAIKKESRKSEPGEDPVQIFLTSTFEYKQYVDLFASKGRLLDKSLAVLKIARDVLGVDGLTASEVSGILIKKFRVSKVHKPNVSTELKDATGYVHRLKTETDYKYLLMAAGEQHLEEVVKSK